MSTSSRPDGRQPDELRPITFERDFTEMAIDVEVWDLDHLTQIMSGLKARSVVSKVERVF